MTSGNFEKGMQTFNRRSSAQAGPGGRAFPQAPTPVDFRSRAEILPSFLPAVLRSRIFFAFGPCTSHRWLPSPRQGAFPPGNRDLLRQGRPSFVTA